MILKDLLTVINSINAIKITIHQLNRDRSIKSGFSYNFTEEYSRFIKTYLPEDFF